MRQFLPEKFAGYLAFVFLLYPIMVVKYLPFGGGARYLTVLSSTAALLILALKWREAGGGTRLLRLGAAFVAPFLPLVAGLAFLALYHQQQMDLGVIVIAVLCASLMYMALQAVPLSERHLAWSAAMAGWLYLIVACYEVFYLGRDRAWGGVYENRFGEFCVLGIGVGVIYVLRQWSRLAWGERAWMAGSLGATIYALVLSASRGPFLAFAALIVYVVWRNLRKKWFLIALAGGLALAAVVIAQSQSPYMDRVRLAFLEIWRFFEYGNVRGSSVGMRLEFWRIAIETTPLDQFFGKGKMPYAVIAEKFPVVRDGALYMNEFYTGAGVANPWGSDGDMPQLIGYGGYFLLLIYLATFLLLLRAGKLNAYKLWVLSCAFLFGLGEVVFFHRIGFAMVVSCWALASAIPIGPEMRALR